MKKFGAKNDFKYSYFTSVILGPCSGCAHGELQFRLSSEQMVNDTYIDDLMEYHSIKIIGLEKRRDNDIAQDFVTRNRSVPDELINRLKLKS